MNAKDMLRNRLSGLAPLFLFAWLLVIYYALALMLPEVAARLETNPLRAALPSILMTGIAGVAFMATAVPLVSMREHGLLRLLGTTPLKNSTFLAALLPARFVFIVLEAAIILGVIWLADFGADGTVAWRLVVTLVIGSGMLFMCALLFASRARSTESVHQLSTMLVMGMFVFSGDFLPPGTLPGFTEIVTNLLPSTWFTAALGADLVGTTPFLTVPMLWAMMLAVTVAAALVALQRFEWDQEEKLRSSMKHNRRMGKKAMVS